MYAEHWAAYAALGWTPLPLPRRDKFPPPKGYTGAARLTPDRRQMMQWAEDRPGANIALPMPPGVIGVDVDAYHGGGETLTRWTSKLGKFPDTVWSSSGRGDGSGIWYFTIPKGVRLVHALTPGIEVIQYHHRYAVAPPSRHPEGRRYRWHDTDSIPWADDFPWLPDSWTDALAATSEASGHGFDGTVEDWLDSLPDRRFSPMLALEYNAKVRALSLTPGSRHDTMSKIVNWLVHLGAEGHNVRDALDDLYMTFTTAVEADRDGEPEFFSALAWAIRNFGAVE